jgi:hypothetical protein
MFAHPGPAPPAQGADLIARAVGAWALATPGGHAGHAGAPRRWRQAANRLRQTTAEGGWSR